LSGLTIAAHGPLADGIGSLFTKLSGDDTGGQTFGLLLSDHYLLNILSANLL